MTDGDPKETTDPAEDAGDGRDAAPDVAPNLASNLGHGDSERVEIPLFPLRTVLFSGGQLPLKIFETRYTGMVSSCLKQDIGFGVVLLRKGLERRQGPNSETPEFFDVGTEANIVDFNQLNDGVLGIVAQGGRKFRVLRTWQQPDLLMMGEVAYLPDEPKAALGDEHAGLVDILQELVQHPMVQKLSLDIDFADARSVGWRLAELLPIEPEIKQSLLQLHLPKERLSELTRLVNKLRA